ncbi:MAG: hypothetical protein QNI99_14135 [Woeseiaceae bacterium]|nr:hypothetical protein [Woeseiaceae bacterium]
MKKLVLITALFALQACTSDSSLPNPTGKGTVRAINAIEGSPSITFLIEERSLESISFKAASTAQQFDDFEYNFNFDVFIPADAGTRRIGTVFQKVDVGRDYTFIVSGDLLTPTVTVWETDERTFDDAETVFEMRFGHLSDALGTVDIYFDAPGVAPVLGSQRGTLSSGEVLGPLDLEEGEYVLTITAQNDPSTLIYQTDTIIYAPRLAQTLTIFDGNENDVAAYNVRLINSQAGIANLPDVLTQPTVRIFQAAISLPPSDVYDDEMLTNLVLPNHQFGDFTGDISVPEGVTTYTYTAVGNTSAIQFESGINAFAGTHSNFIVIGDMDNRVATTYVPDRRRITTQVRFTVYHAAFNFEDLDLYLVEPGTPIDDDVTRFFPLDYSLNTPPLSIDEGSYELFATVRGEKTIVGGPLAIDVTFGDTLEILLLDTVDPNVVEFRLIPPP